MGRAATKHLVKKCTKAPPVNRFPVTDPLDDFRRQILRSTAERVSLLTLLVAPNSFLRQPKVRDFKVTLGVEQDVFGLQIPVDDVI